VFTFIRKMIICSLGVVFLGFITPFNSLFADTVTLESDQGTFTIETNGNTIKTSFVPKEGVDCEKIVFVQTVKSFFWDGDSWEMTTPLEENSDWEYKDDDTTEDGTRVDHIFCEKDPAYNGDDTNKDSGQQGSSGDPPTPSKMSDGPNKPDDKFPVRGRCYMCR
jgi:hypothetical protein